MSYYDEGRGYGQGQYGQGGYSGQQGGYGGQQQGYGGQQGGYGGAPQVPPPWMAEWDSRENRWGFINRETGERTHQHPQERFREGGYGGGNYGGGNYGGGYGGGGGGGGGYGQEYGAQDPRGYGQPPEKKDHHNRNMALGVAGGVLGGALLMHEGEKVERDWDQDKDRLEYDARQGVDDVENFPDDAANWTGRKVGEVEDIPQDIERKWDDGVQDVEDIPDDVAGWTGRKVGDVERFDDNIDNSYDQGRDDTRYDDNYRDDNY